MPTTPHAQPKHVLPDQGSIYRARGGLYTFKLLASNTKGAFTLSEASNPPNTGVPPHIQHWEDETFIVLQGRYTFRAGDETFHCGPGEVIYVPRGVAHAFENTGTEPARMLILQAPGGIHEQYFAEANQEATRQHLATDPLGRVRIGVLCALCQCHLFL